MTISKVLLSICFLLANPNPEEVMIQGAPYDGSEWASDGCVLVAFAMQTEHWTAGSSRWSLLDRLVVKGDSAYPGGVGGGGSPSARRRAAPHVCTGRAGATASFFQFRFWLKINGAFVHGCRQGFENHEELVSRQLWRRRLHADMHAAPHVQVRLRTSSNSGFGRRYMERACIYMVLRSM